MNLIVTLIVGGIAGWLANMLMKGKGMGIIWNIILGIVGAWIGSIVFGLLGLKVSGMFEVVGYIVQATVGAMVVLMIARTLSRR